MKKIVLVLVTLFCLVGCGKNDYTEINYTELMNKLDNKDTFVLVMGSDTCSACAQYKETMESVIKDTGVEIFYLNLHTLSEEEYSKNYSKFVVTSTPTTLFFENGQETTTYDRIIGAASYTKVIEELKEHGYVGE